MLLRVHRYLTAAFALGASLCMAAIFLIVLINSLRRYFMGRSWPWGEELPVYLAIYGVMFGISMAVMQERHIAFRILTDFLSPRLQRMTALAVDLMTVAVGIILARSGLLLIESRGARDASGLVTTMRGLSRDFDMPWIAQLGTLGPWQFALVIGGVMLSIAACIQFLTRLFTPAPEVTP
ncbi:MAG: TRAP transporter small permease subunit [Natronohydrobacter sp.]|nr:TRAP transporter small permease subunit [Natronohydrobacter sp.]